MIGSAHQHGAPATASVLVWCLFLLSACATTGFALVRPFIAAPGRRGRTLVVTAAALAVAAGWLLTRSAPLPPQAWIPPASSVAVACAVWLTTAPENRWTGTARLVAPVPVVLGAGYGVAAACAGWFGTAETAAAVSTGALLTGCAALGWLALCRPVRRVSVLALRGTAMLGAVSVLASLAQVATAGPFAAIPLLGQVGSGRDTVRVLVVPHRPGWNLVQVGSGSVEIGPAPDRLVPVTGRPGAPGSWSLVWLPSGRSRLWVKHDDRLRTLALDTGHGPGTVDLLGADGPECASAALGGLLAGSKQPLRSCPADSLTPGDARALRATVHFLAARGTTRATLVTDTSPRSAAAAEVVREASALAGITLGTPEHAGGPMLVVAGWATAEGVLRDSPAVEGCYLAPWLLSRQLLDRPVGKLLPLPFSPGDNEPARYSAALHAGFPPAVPTTSGYREWLANRRATPAEPYRLFAASALDPLLLPRSRSAHSGQTWFPGGAITPVTGPISP